MSQRNSLASLFSQQSEFGMAQYDQDLDQMEAGERPHRPTAHRTHGKKGKKEPRYKGRRRGSNTFTKLTNVIGVESDSDSSDRSRSSMESLFRKPKFRLFNMNTRSDSMLSVRSVWSQSTVSKLVKGKLIVYFLSPLVKPWI